MAVTKTARLGLTRWSAGTDPFTRAQMEESHAALETSAAMFAAGTLANRPAPGKAGRFYEVTNAAAGAPTLFYDTGTVWKELRPDLSGYAAKSHSHGIGDLPAAASGQSSDALLVRANDQRLSDQRAPLAHDSSLVTSGRLGPKGAEPISDWNNAVTAGWHTGSGASNAPASGTLVGLVSVANATDAFVTQDVWAVSETSPTDSKRWERRLVSGGWTAWRRVRFLQAELDALYAAVSHSHTKAQISDFAHSHGIGDLPVAGSGQSATSLLVRADDARLSNARTPTAHDHDSRYYTEGEVNDLIAAVIPSGFFMDGGRSDVPVGWLLCDGSAVGRAAYPSLYSALGTKWGTGDGSTTFNLPDFRDRVRIGAGERSVGATDSVASGSRIAARSHVHTHSNDLGVASAGAHTHGVSGSTSAAGGHSHAVFHTSATNTTATGGATRVAAISGTDSEANHTHSVSGSTDSQGAHAHSLTGGVSSASAGEDPYAVVRVFVKI